MSARDRILGRLKKSPATIGLELPDVLQWSASHQRHENTAQRVNRLRDALEASHAEVYLTTAENWPSLVAEIVAAKGIGRLLVGPNTPISQTLAHANQVPLLHYDKPIEAWQKYLFEQVEASLTQAKSAIAETGTLILWPDASEPRLMSLVPPIHMVLLDAAAIHADFHAAMLAEDWQHSLPTNALLISGPSKTADIQQTLAYGAHGPRELIVLIVQAEGSTP